MKFKKVAALCKQSGDYVLMDDVTDAGELRGQWLGNGAALYLLDGDLPALTENSLCAILGITKKQRESLSFRNEPAPDTINVRDTDENERLLERVPISFLQDGRELIPLRGRDGMILIDARYLEPLRDMDEDDVLGLYERRMSNGTPYIVAKCGMFAVSVISPYIDRRKETVASLEYIAAAARAAYQSGQQGGETLA